MDTFTGNWTPEEKQIVRRALALHNGADTTNSWHFYKHGSFSAQRQSWASGGLRSETAEEMACKVQAYYSRGG